MITQRFYPRTFDVALKTAGDSKLFAAPENPGDPATADIVFFLFKVSSGVTWDPERFLTFPDIIDYFQLAYFKTTSMSVQRVGAKLEFTIPTVSWKIPNNESFQHCIIAIAKDGWPAFMHIDFGEVLNPQAGFEIRQSVACIPHIDFTPITCAG